MAKNSPVERMQVLDEALRAHSWLYNVKSEPVISNELYDEMEREFRGLCERYPELAIHFESHNRAVPIDLPNDGPLEIIRFTEPMLSVKKVNTLEELDAFIAKLPAGTELEEEIKLDGLAIRLLYKGGVLKSMATRGAGMEGEEVIHARPLFVEGAIPLKIDTDIDEVEIRGETWISIKDFETYNESVTEKKKDPRNAVSGWVRTSPDRIDHNVFDTLQFSAYWSNETFGCVTYRELKGKFQSFGFDTPLVLTRRHIEENARNDLIPNDGIMVKVNSLKLQKELGVSNRHPNWSVGYKFPPVEGTPTLKDVEWNTSGYGRIIPVAIYSPVKLGAVLCSRASLDNYGTFMELGLGIGDVVSVTRNNDVIPRLNKIIEQGEGPPLEAPTECPSCSSLLEVRIGVTSSELVCNNISGCPAQLVNRTVIMGDKFGFDIDGLGPVIVADLVERGYVTRSADVFDLGEGKRFISESLRINIEAAKTQTLDRVLKALCFPDVGVVLSKRIASAFENRPLEILEGCLTDIRFLTAIKGISNGIGMKIVRAFDNPSFEENFHYIMNTIAIKQSAVFNPGIKVAITGSFTQGRDKLVEFFAGHDIELSDKLTLDCKYLIKGERPGNSKLLKATENAIPMLDVTQYKSIEDLIHHIKEN